MNAREAITERVLREAEAGLHDKGDVFVRVEPRPQGSGMKLRLTSKVMSLFGDQIRNTVLQELERYGLYDVLVTVEDHGALDYAIKARVQTAIERACREEQ